MVLGWHVRVFRQVGGGDEPAGADAWVKGARVAVWQTRLGGLSWIEGLVTQDRAIDLGGNGHPNRDTARARDLLPPIETGPPEANPHWRADPTRATSSPRGGRGARWSIVPSHGRVDRTNG